MVRSQTLDAKWKLLQRGRGATMPRLSSRPTVMTVKELSPWKFVNSLIGEFQTTSYTLLGAASASLGCGRCSQFWRRSDGSKRDHDSLQSNRQVARQSSRPTILRRRMLKNGVI